MAPGRSRLEDQCQPLWAPEGKDVVTGPPDDRLPFLPGDEPDRFDHLDLEGLPFLHGAMASFYDTAVMMLLHPSYF